MQSYKYDKAIPPESKNGGSPALNNNPAKSSSKKALLICLDCLCLVMGSWNLVAVGVGWMKIRCTKPSIFPAFPT